MEAYYAKQIKDVLDNLQSSERGLSAAEVSRRLKEYGANKLPEASREPLINIFFRQFKSPLIYILFVASLIVLSLGEISDGLIILFVLIFNAIVGTFQEGRAEQTLQALRQYVETNATVVRDGTETIVPDSELVKGDIIVLHEGEKVPADARLLIARSLKLDEAALTGESGPVHKTVDVIRHENIPVAEQKNMIFKGTHIVSGNGVALVVATGLATFIGEISQKIAAIDTEIPLRANIRYLSRLIVAVVLCIVSAIFFFGLWLGLPTIEMFKTAVSVAVAIIPEGLIVVMTLVLATGVWRMSKQHALVKRLQAVEALGQARIIAVDKTGTITKNEMVVRKIYIDGKTYQVGGVGYEPKGELTFEGNAVDPLNHPELIIAGKVAAFCANARASFVEKEARWHLTGDPTEAALLILAEKIGFKKDELETESPLRFELPFDYKVKYHATFHDDHGKLFVTVAGAPESIFSLTHKIFENGEIHPFSTQRKTEIEKILHNLLREGLRVVAFSFAEASLPHDNEKINIDNTEVVFAGFYAIEDSLRPEVEEAMQRAHKAGMRVVMITGDHKLTAETIAKKAGIYKEGDSVLTGVEIDFLNDEELSKKLSTVTVFARVTPEHKLRIIEAFRRRGEIVAMTGDGVNDALSLVAADLGVAMGKIGTEVAKEAADIVLLDDNFGSIVSAVEEGRSIYKTMKKVILYLFSTSIGEVLMIVGAMALGYPLPILPAQILWLNLVTDGFLDVALAMEPKEKGLLRGTFERPKKYLIDSLMVQRMAVMAIPMTIGSLFLFSGYVDFDLKKAWTISLTVLAVFQWFNAWNCRSERESVFRMHPLANKFLAMATLIVIALQFFAIYHPFMQKILHTIPLTLGEWGIIILVSFSIIIFEEIRKFFYRRIKTTVSVIA
ncbi:HAD-IC family P-type ATPase [Candidatus Jorgensenbacteria bacterium]|nr:HAD-IC family P-type ATPase [Candidatus Jorgensenbacteria bacterium]